MQDLNDKVTNGTLSAPEWNEVPSEIQNVIENLGQVLTSSDLLQLAKGIVGYAGAGTFYVDTGAADAYVLTEVGSKVGPSALNADHDGFLVRFRAANANTGASTLNLSGLGSKAIVREDFSAVQSGDIVTSKDMEVRYRHSATDFVLAQHLLSSSAEVSQGYLSGFQTSRDGGDPANDINFTAGICRDDADTTTMERAEITKKIDVDWVAGDDQGGFPSALTIAIDTTYHLFIIKNTSTGVVDAGFDTNLAATNLLADATGYTPVRRVGSIRTAAGATTIEPYFQDDDWFGFVDILQDVNQTGVTDAETLVTLRSPLGLILPVTFNANVQAGSQRECWIYDTRVTSATPSSTAAPGANIRAHDNGGYGQLTVYTDVTQQVALRSSAASTTFNLCVLGWTDRRGKGA